MAPSPRRTSRSCPRRTTRCWWRAPTAWCVRDGARGWLRTGEREKRAREEHLASRSPLRPRHAQVPAVADVLDLFAFLPRWRVDDVMISYCAVHGSVGPHSDNYDVFLLQAGGPKRWGISADPKYDPDDEEAHEQGPMVRVLKDWAPQAQRLVRAGDMLYLPPRVAHHGVATEAGQTLSVGALAPRHEELMMSYVETLSAEAEAMIHSPRWTDPDLALQVRTQTPAWVDGALT
jgi:ribosomal protein L16 Arg81 hydroxylase